MKLFKIISILALTATLTGCHFGGGVTVVHPKKKTTTVVYEEPSHTHTTVVVEEPSHQPSSSSTVVVYEDSHHNLWYCDDGSTIPSEWVCDGYSDCWDNSDEHYCSSTVVVVEEYYTPEPYYHDYCEYVGFYGDEECCYDYDVQEVWISPHEYVYEVCEYTTCVDYDFNVLTEDSVNCWYE